MKLLRLALLALTVSLAATACGSSSITAPDADTGNTWLGSGSQVSPSGKPNLTGNTWLGSGS